MKKGLFGYLMLLVIPPASFAQYPPMYGPYAPYRAAAPYGYAPMGYYPPTMVMPQSAAPPVMPPSMMAPAIPTQSIPGYAGPKATPAVPTQLPGASVEPGAASSLPTFDAGVLGAAPAPAPEPVNGDLLHPRLRQPDRFWINAAYTPTFIRKGPLGVPLVTLGSPLDAAPGALGQPGTTVVFGNQDLDFNRLDGLRAAAGIWFDTEDHLGLEVQGMFTQPSYVRFATASDSTGKPVIGLPVFVTNSQPDDPPAEAAFRIAALNGAAGFVNIEARTRYLDFEVNARLQDYFSPVTRGSLLFGVRTAYLDEYLNINSGLRVLPNGAYFFRGNALAEGESLRIQDRFSTNNQFYGLQTGGQWSLDLDRFFLELNGKIAVGVTHQQVRIDGLTTLLPNGGRPTSAVGGLLALPSNMGVHNRYQFSLLPEVGVNLGFNVCEWMRIKGGYSLSVWSDVTRPGQAIDRNIDVTQPPASPQFGQLPAGDGSPRLGFRDEMLWLHLFNFGVEIHY